MNNASNDIVNRRIDKLAHEAFGSAYNETLAMNEKVHAVAGDTLYLIHADGTKTKLKKVAQRIKRDPNKSYTLKA